MNRTDRIGNGALGMGIGVQNGLDGPFDIAYVVHGIENTEDVDAVDHTTFDEFIDHVIGIVAIAQDVLAPEQHLLWGVWHCRFEQTQPFPGVFSQVADAGIKGGTAPGFD